MEFIETPIFSRAIKGVLTDDQLHQIQITLSLYPHMGDIIPHSGGIRKLRWVRSGKGKRGGLRVIYFWVVGEHKIYLLYLYAKSKQENMTIDQLRTLREIIEGS